MIHLISPRPQLLCFYSVGLGDLPWSVPPPKFCLKSHNYFAFFIGCGFISSLDALPPAIIPTWPRGNSHRTLPSSHPSSTFFDPSLSLSCISGTVSYFSSSLNVLDLPLLSFDLDTTHTHTQRNPVHLPKASSTAVSAVHPGLPSRWAHHPVRFSLALECPPASQHLMCPVWLPTCFSLASEKVSFSRMQTALFTFCLTFYRCSKMHLNKWITRDIIT